MAADSKVFQRGNTRIPVGVCIGLANTKAFEQKYDEFFDKAFVKFNNPKPKVVFNSVDLNRIFGGDYSSYCAFLESFVKEITTVPDLVINVAFSMINSKLLDKDRVRYYGAHNSTVESVPFMKFIDHLTQYYPYIAPWAVQSQAGISGATVHLDDFQGSITEAWIQLKAKNFIQVYPNGDLCNREISAADLMVRYLDEKMRRDWIRVDEPGFTSVLKELQVPDFHVFYVGNPHLKSITPLEPKPIQMTSVYKRPMLFILKEGVMEKEKEFLERRLESMQAIQRFAFKNQTGYKFIAYEKDYKLMKDGDIVLHLGQRGKEQCDLLETMGYSLKVMSLNELKTAA